MVVSEDLIVITATNKGEIDENHTYISLKGTKYFPFLLRNMSSKSVLG